MNEAAELGRSAVGAATEGKTGVMAALERVSENPYRASVVFRPVDKIANAIRRVPDEFINAASNGITPAGVAYLRPLIAGERSVKYSDGLPIHAKI